MSNNCVRLCKEITTNDKEFFNHRKEGHSRIDNGVRQKLITSERHRIIWVIFNLDKDADDRSEG